MKTSLDWTWVDTLNIQKYAESMMKFRMNIGMPNTRWIKMLKAFLARSRLVKLFELRMWNFEPNDFRYARGAMQAHPIVKKI